MAEFAVYADSKGRGFCRSCGARVTWAKTPNGTRIPIDGWNPVPSRTQGGLLEACAVEYYDTAVTPTHFETCPEAETWRKR